MCSAVVNVVVASVLTKLRCLGNRCLSISLPSLLIIIIFFLYHASGLTPTSHSLHSGAHFVLQFTP